ncbi:MAG: hypothetical protein L6R41_006874 [Letrouitia leprolyta]|nr:MAG: hypothetical protein L6R41_006874 [Letrouitia leprolyta]
MSARGIADLRAKFENQHNDTSPPSRGRSPAGQESVVGGEKRKIRTSFISVEKSGQMGPSADRESIGSNEGQKVGTDTTNETEAGMNGEKDRLMSTTNDSKNEIGQQENGENSKETTGTNNRTLHPEEAALQDAINPDKPSTAEENDVPLMQPSDPKDELAVTGGEALAPKGESLGALLKGSEFEEGEELKNPSPEKSIIADVPTTPKKTKTPQKINKGRPNTDSTAKINGSPRSKLGSTRSTPLKKPVADPDDKPPTISLSASKDPTEPSKAPLSPTDTTKSQKESVRKPASPGQHAHPKAQAQPSDVEKKKMSTRPLTRPSTSAKPAKPAKPVTSSGKPATSSASSSDAKIRSPTSPKAVKPKAKSPTRPVRLPGAATAMTAASAAKHGSAAAAPEPSSRASLSGTTRASTLHKPTTSKAPHKPAPSVAPSLRSKAPRSSLPASSTVPKPKPRTSLASTNAAGGDFLARMMRPTQASASKTHEKVEQKTPPKKRVFSRPKKIGDEDSEQPESKSAQSEPAAEEEKTNQSGSVSGHQPEADEGDGSNEIGSTAVGTDTAREADVQPPTDEPAESNIGGTVTEASHSVSVL